MATHNVKELVCYAGVEKESVTAVLHAFHTQSDMNHSAKYPLMSVGRHSGRNLLYIREGKSPGLPAVSNATMHHVWASFHSSL